MKRISTILLTVSLGFSGVLLAQQDPQFTQFMYVKQAYNPAFVGTDGTICANALFRQQWVNFPGAPKTGLFTMNMPIQSLGMGAGLMVMNDALGFQATTTVRAQAAKHFFLGESGSILSVGLDAGIMQSKINGSFIAPQTLNDPSIPSNPQTGTGLGINGTNSPALNKITPDIGLGLYFTMPNKMYIGVSATHLAAPTLQGATAPSSQIGSVTNVGYNLTYDVARHLYIISGYTFNLGSSGENTLTPNIKVKTDFAATQLDMNLTYCWNRKVNIGLTYRLQDAVAPMFMLQDIGVKGLKIGYSYDITTSKIKGYSSGTHEIMLGYCLKPKDKAKTQSHWNTRYFED